MNIEKALIIMCNSIATLSLILFFAYIFYDKQFAELFLSVGVLTLLLVNIHQMQRNKGN